MFVAYSNLAARTFKIDGHHQIEYNIQVDLTTTAIVRLQESINDSLEIINKNLEKVKEDIKTLKFKTGVIPLGRRNGDVILDI